MKWTHFLKYTTYQDRTKKGEKKKNPHRKSEESNSIK